MRSMIKGNAAGRCLITLTLLAIGTLFLPLAPAVAADDSKAAVLDGSATEAQEQQPSGIDAAIAKLTVHGYLSKAYATASEHQLYGIPTGGTFDYRTAALQFGYQLTSDDRFVIQLSHERIGAATAASHENTVELDWIFYEHRFDADTSAKIGKIQIPYGIFNEVRDVGTLLPFYRAPAEFYGETSYANETVDGAMVSRRFFTSTPWTLDVSAFVGSWEFALAGQTTKADVELAGGLHAWLSTPIEGVRIGGGYRRMGITGASRKTEGRVYWTDGNLAVEADLGRAVVRAEWRKTDFGTGSWYKAYYGQVGVQLIGDLWLNAQYEHSTNKFDIPGSPTKLTLDMLEDKAAGLNYAFRPDLKLKAEYHWNSGYYVEDVLFPTVLRHMLTDDPFDAKYAIVSIAVSF
jgi:hypothetical protein